MNTFNISAIIVLIAFAGFLAPSESALTSISRILIEELELSVRAYNCLKRAHIHNLGELLKYSKENLLEFKNFGQI